MFLMHRRRGDGEDDTKLAVSITSILRENVLLSLATISPSGVPHICTTYFSYSYNVGSLCLYIFTSPQTDHARNVDSGPRVGISICNSQQPFGSDIKGLQLSGTCVELSLMQSIDAFNLYSIRFPELLTRAATVEAVFSDLPRRFYRIDVFDGKLLDELAFGKKVLVPFTVAAARIKDL